MSRCLEPDHRTDFRALLVIHLLQCTTANNRQQKTTFISQFVTQVLPKLSSNFNQGLRVMTRRFCVHLAKSYSAVLQASTTYQLYQISMVWIVKCYQVRSQSLKTTTLGTHAREKNAAVMVKTTHQNDLHDILPVLYKVASILATIPATLCSAERSFSALLHQDIKFHSAKLCSAARQKFYRTPMIVMLLLFHRIEILSMKCFILENMWISASLK